MKGFKQNISGMSLQSIMVALVLFAGASMLFIQMIKTYNNASEGGRLRTEIDSTHSLAFQFLRQGLTKKINWDLHISGPAKACLSGTGTNCQTVTATPQPFIGAAQSNNPLLKHFEDKTLAAARDGTPTANTATCTGNSCGINHNLTYELVDCSSTKCEGIELVVNTTYNSGRLAAPIAPRVTPVRVAAATVLGTQPTMSKDCSGRVDSINLSAQDLKCAPPTDKSVCPPGTTNNPLAFGDKLSQDGSDCRSLATISCSAQQALGLMDADNPQCVDAPDFQMYSASDFEIITPPATVTVNGTVYTAEKCEVCSDSGQQTCEKLEVRKCHQSDGTQVDVNKCLEQGKDFTEVLRYSHTFTKTCTPPVYRGDPSCPNAIPLGRNRDGSAVAGYTCPANKCQACKPNWVYAAGWPGRFLFNQPVSIIQVYGQRCLRMNTGGRFSSGGCAQWSGTGWQNIGFWPAAREYRAWSGWWIYASFDVWASTGNLGGGRGAGGTVKPAYPQCFQQGNWSHPAGSLCHGASVRGKP